MILLLKIRERDEFHTWLKILGDVPNCQIGEREKRKQTTVIVISYPQEGFSTSAPKMRKLTSSRKFLLTVGQNKDLQMNFFFLAKRAGQTQAFF